MTFVRQRPTFARLNSWGFALLISALLIGALLVLAPMGAYGSYQGGSLTLRQPEPETLDPAKVRYTTDFGLSCQLFEPLVEYNPLKGAVEPCLADSWDVGDDGRVYTFHLQAGVRFSDGRALTSADVKASIERFIQLSQLDYMQNLVVGGNLLKSGKALSLSGVETPDALTVRIRLVQPIGFLIPALTPILITPKGSPGVPVDWTRPVGTGPFKVDEWRRGSFIKFVRNGAYRVKGLPRLDGFRIDFRGSGSDLDDFIKGRNAAVGVSYAAALSWMDDDYYRSYVRITRELGVNYINLNTAKAPLDNRLVRQALNHLLDLEAAGMQQGAEFTRLGGVIPPDMPGHLHTTQPFNFNITKAKALLAEAGYTDLAKFPRVSLICGSEDSKAVYDLAWGANLRRVGIKYTSTVLTMNEIDSRTEKGNFTAIASSWAPDYVDQDALLYALLHPDSRNCVGFSFAPVTTLIEQGRALVDPKERQAVYNKLQTMVHDLAPMIFGWSETRYSLVDPTLIAWEKASSSELPLLKYVWSDSPRYRYSTTDVASAPTAYTEALRALGDKNWDRSRQLLAETRANFADYRNQSTSLQLLISLAQARAVLRSSAKPKASGQLRMYLSDLARQEQFLDLPKGDLILPFNGFEFETLPWARAKDLSSADQAASALVVDVQREFVYCAEYVQGHGPKPVTNFMPATLPAANIVVKPALLYRLLADVMAQLKEMPEYTLWLYDQAILYAAGDETLEDELERVRNQTAKEASQW